MKNLFSAAVLMILTAFFITPSFAQKPKSKDDSIKEMAALVATKKPEDIEKAYQIGKDVLTRFGKDNDERIGKVRVFVNNYRENTFYTAVDGKKNAEAFAIGKEILAEQPDNTAALLNLAFAGYNASNAGDKTYVEDSIAYARKSLQLMEAGNLPKNFAPFKDKDEATGFMYYVDGSLSMSKDMKSAAATLYKATLYESPIKNSPQPYYLIASYYEDLYTKMAGVLKAKVDAKTINDGDFKTESEKVEKVIDLMEDAYARTCKRADAENNPNKTIWKDRLTQVYKFRNKTDAGLAEYITYINTTPLPDPGKF